MSVVVVLRGGPFGGQMVGLDVPPWAPPLTLWFPEVLSAPMYDDLPLLSAEPLAVHAYDRCRSTRDYGPAWRYMYRQPE